MDRIHIIMAIYNGEAYLREQIQSIADSTYKEWILWIFDDGEGEYARDIIDGQPEIVREHVRYTKNPVNKGVTRNFLEGVKTVSAQCGGNIFLESSSEYENYYMFCDQDDVWMPDKIEKTLNLMKKLEKRYSQKLPFAVFTDAIIADEKLKTVNPSFHRSNHLDSGKLDMPHMLMENKLIGCTVMFNASLEKKLTPVPNFARYHDWWIGLIGAAFGRIEYLPEATLYYRQHGSNVVGNQDFKGYVRNRIFSLKEQRNAIISNAKQAGEFYKIYKETLTREHKMQVYAMANLMRQGWLIRRISCIRHGFLKTGFLRNVALLLIL